MDEILTMPETKQRYPNQWVLIEMARRDPKLNIERGRVVATAPTRLEIYQILRTANVRRFTIEYTGEPPEDEAYLFCASHSKDHATQRTQPQL